MVLEETALAPSLHTRKLDLRGIFRTVLYGVGEMAVGKRLLYKGWKELRKEEKEEESKRRRRKN